MVWGETAYNWTQFFKTYFCCSEHNEGGRPTERAEAETETGFFQVAAKALKKVSAVGGELPVSREGIGKPPAAIAEPPRGGPLQPLQLVVNYLLLTLKAC